MGKQKIKNNNKLKRTRKYGYKNITIGKQKSRSNSKLVCCLLGAILIYLYDLSKSGIPDITY